MDKAIDLLWLSAMAGGLASLCILFFGRMFRLIPDWLASTLFAGGILWGVIGMVLCIIMCGIKILTEK